MLCPRGRGTSGGGCPGFVSVPPRNAQTNFGDEGAFAIEKHSQHQGKARKEPEGLVSRNTNEQHERKKKLERVNPRIFRSLKSPA